MHGWQANKKRTCALPVILGLCPKMKYPPLCGGIFIVNENHAIVAWLKRALAMNRNERQTQKALYVLPPSDEVAKRPSGNE